MSILNSLFIKSSNLGVEVYNILIGKVHVILKCPGLDSILIFYSVTYNSFFLQQGDTTVLVTAVSKSKPPSASSFMPLTVGKLYHVVFV